MAPSSDSVLLDRSRRCLTQADVGAQTRERLLETAERLFSQRGYAVTSVRDITAEASCNVAAVTYHFGGKRSPAHAAAVVGDTVGDPLKDTAGPSLHVLIKLLSTLSIVFIPLFLNLLHLI